MKVETMKVQPVKAVPIVIPKKFQDVKVNKNIAQNVGGFNVGISSPLGARPLTQAATSAKTEMLKDSSNLPQCNVEQQRRYDENWEKIVSPTVIKSLRRHKQDVLHGGRSLNMLLPTKRPTKDWDIYSVTEKARAQAIEREIDKKAGCNICDVKRVEMPKVSPGPDTPGTSKRLYRIVTQHTNDDADVDVMDRPKDIKTVRHHGISHESLDSAYVKAVKRMKLQPMYMWKAMQDKKRIEEYWAAKGKSPPQLSNGLIKL